MLLKRIGIQTAQLGLLREFYENVLELEIESLRESAFLIKIGESEIELVETNTGDPFYHFAINIPSNKIEEARGWLLNKVKLLWMEDYKSDIADFKNWHAKSVYFFDPAGNIVELIARFDLKNEVSEPFS